MAVCFNGGGARRLPICWQRATLAIYAQLIYLMTPFVVAILAACFCTRSCPLFVRALAISLVGVLLVMSGSLREVGVETAVTRNDLLGISLALVSTLSLALYMILTRRIANPKASGEGLLIVHLISLFSFAFLASLLLGEDWYSWATLGQWIGSSLALFALASYWALTWGRFAPSNVWERHL